MIARMIVTISGVLIAGLLLFNITSLRADNESGIVRVRSAYPLAETVNRLTLRPAMPDERQPGCFALEEERGGNWTGSAVPVIKEARSSL